MDETVRLRLLFENRRILSKPQKSEKLKRCWILLKPQHRTISDLASYLTSIFELQSSCPNGLVLSMDGFVLPPFESTCILKDRDIVRVVRKEANCLEGVETVEKQPVVNGLKLLADEEFDRESEGYGSEPAEGECCQPEAALQVENTPVRNAVSKKRKASRKLNSSNVVRKEANCLEGVEIVEKQPVVNGLKLLADEEFDKESGGYGSEPEEGECCQPEAALQVENTPVRNAVSKKRKASKKLNSSKRKKNKHATAEDCPVVLEDDENDVRVEKNESCRQQSVLPETSLAKKDKSSDVHGETHESSATETNERSNGISNSTPSAKRVYQLQENGKGCANIPNTCDGTKKCLSRNTRRKKAKRLWLREQAKMENKELHRGQLLEHDNQQLPDSVSGKISEECQQKQLPEKDNQHLPDHVSEKLPEEYQQPDQCSDGDEEIFPVEDRPGHIRFGPLGKDQSFQIKQFPLETFQWNGITSKKKGQKWGKENFASCKRSDYRRFNQEYSEMLTVEEETPANDPIDFDKLMPFIGLPKEGDVLAYRLIELSSSWTPEITSFRVGKVSHFYPESNKILLVQVSEYPIIFEKKINEEASTSEPDPSLYGEDGSLKVDFSSLIDIRIVKRGNLDPAKATIAVNEVPLVDQNAAASSRPNNKIEETLGPTQENGLVNAWKEISQALNEKKAELSQEDDWTKNESSSGKSWSYKALRSSALGPTMAFLRAQNGL